jgi:Fe(3+) dicitrate transport protein
VQAGEKPSSPPPTATQTPPAPQSSEHPPETEIPDVVVTESELPPDDATVRTPLRNTAARDVLSPREVEEAGTLNLQEFLRRTPSVTISEETGSESLPNIALRGVSGNDGIFRSVNVAMLVDGIPLASAPSGAPGASLFPFTMERLYAADVQRGGASVRFGPNNVSGVINFLTKPIPTHATFESRTRYNSFDDGSFYNAFGTTYGRFGYLLETVYKHGDSFRDHGDYTLQNYSLKTSYQFDEDLRALVQVESFDDDTNLSDGLSLAQFRADPDQSTSKRNRFEGDQRRVNAKLEWNLGSDTRVDFVTYYYETERTFFLGSPLFYGTTPTFLQATPRPMSVWAIAPQLTHEYTLGDVDGTLVTGVRFLREDIRRRVERYFPDGSFLQLSDDGYDYLTGSAFVENTFEFGRWRVTPGVRFESVDIHARNQGGTEVQRDFEEILPAVSTSYLVDDNWSVYANVQTSFQPPSANQIDLANEQDISAQYAWVYEVGTRGESDDGLVAADLTLYQIDYSDRLEPDPDEFDVLLNSGRSRHRGVELAIDSDLSESGLDGFGVWSTVAYNVSKYENGEFEGNYTPGSPRWMLAWGARYLHERSGLGAGLDGSYVADAYSDRDNTSEINANGTVGVRPSYVLWNAHAHWTRKITDSCRLRFQVDARNLFDQSYFDVRAARGIYPGAPFGYGAEIGLLFQF